MQTRMSLTAYCLSLNSIFVSCSVLFPQDNERSNNWTYELNVQCHNMSSVKQVLSIVIVHKRRI